MTNDHSSRSEDGHLSFLSQTRKKPCEARPRSLSWSDNGANGEDRIWLVWKIPKESVDTTAYSDIGIYPTGELMGVHESHSSAQIQRKRLRDGSPSERFSDTMDMDDAPYRFTVSQWEVYHYE